MKRSKKGWPECPMPIPLQIALLQKQKATKDCADDKVKGFSEVLKKLKEIDRLEMSRHHYFEFLKLGLYLEEYQQRLDLKKFSLPATNIDRVQDENVTNKFKIDFPTAVKEGDLEILNVSDSLKVTDHKGKKQSYLRVTKIHRNYVIAVADKRFSKSYSPQKLYKVVLVFNDYTFRCGHAILTLINSTINLKYIFPHRSLHVHSNEKVNKNQSWFNEEIANNPEQKQAVLNICAKPLSSAPYVLYGPPGTGKTATLVEAVCQIWQDSKDHILICTPSNVAGDVVTSRILNYVEPKNIFRVYSQCQDYSTIPVTIKKCCNYHADGYATELESKMFLSTRIIITTLATCAKLISLKLKLQFSHIFIDEAGQATQPDSLIPLQLMLETKSTTCRIVISGDPQQLGPCIRFKLAEPILGESILEKLMRQEPYGKHKETGYDPNYITKLIRNYRSSSDIIHCSNKLFYDNELIACNGKKLSRFPIIFHAVVKGKEQKVGTLTSSYNIKEIHRVLCYVDYFLETKIGGKKFTKKDIGIVTPFSLQSSILRKELDNKNLRDIDVGTVEIFQGQEKEIIIMSTVRSKTFLHDKGQHIGFLSNPRRFNVAMTRAKTFLVVVGNPNVLKVDDTWKYFLKFCKEKGACRGDSFTLDEDFFQLLQKMNLGIVSKKSTELFNRKLKLFE